MSEAQSHPFPGPPPGADGPERTLQDQVREAVLGSAYGYFDSEPVPTTRAELVERLRRGEPTPLVWTPETGPGLVPAWTVPYLFAAFREHGVKSALNRVVGWGVVFAALVAWGLVQGGGFGNPILLFAFLAGVILAFSVTEYRRFSRLSPEVLRAEVRELRARPAPRAGPARATRVLSGALIAVGVAQLLGGIDPSIQAAGIVKEWVRQGEAWRLLTGALVHGHLLHFVMNFMAFTALGRIVEAYAHRAYVPIVFLVSALGASMASLLLAPEVTSVGASGGIMGMFGFMAVMAIRRRALMPPGFGKAIAVDAGVIVLMGVVGYQFIDNAAHAGGLVTGALIGLLAIPREGTEPYWEPSRAVRLAGNAAMGLVFLGAALAILVIFTYASLFGSLGR